MVSPTLCFSTLCVSYKWSSKAGASSLGFRKQNKPQFFIYFYPSIFPIREMIEAKLYNSHITCISVCFCLCQGLNFVVFVMNFKVSFLWPVILLWDQKCQQLRVIATIFSWRNMILPSSIIHPTLLLWGNIEEKYATLETVHYFYCGKPKKKLSVASVKSYTWKS